MALSAIRLGLVFGRMWRRGVAPGSGLIDAVYYCGNATHPVWRAAAGGASVAGVLGGVACNLP